MPPKSHCAAAPPVLAASGRGKITPDLELWCVFWEHQKGLQHLQPEQWYPCVRSAAGARSGRLMRLPLGLPVAFQVYPRLGAGPGACAKQGEITGFVVRPFQSDFVDRDLLLASRCSQR